MELQEALKERRTIKRFKKTTISDDNIRKLLEAACLSVSTSNRQPWRFMLLQEEAKEGVADIMMMLSEANNIDLPGYACRSRLASTIVKQAPLLILVFKEAEEKYTTGDLLSIGASMGNISLKAVELGLASMWVSEVRYSEYEIEKYVGAEGLKLLSAIAIGYADEIPAPQSRKDPLSFLLEPKVNPSRSA